MASATGGIEAFSSIYRPGDGCLLPHARGQVAAGGVVSERPGGLEDQSRRYTVAIPEDRIDDLRALLRRAGNSFGQREIYFVVAGYETIVVRPEDGFLEI